MGQSCCIGQFFSVASTLLLFFSPKWKSSKSESDEAPYSRNLTVQKLNFRTSPYTQNANLFGKRCCSNVQCSDKKQIDGMIVTMAVNLCGRGKKMERRANSFQGLSSIYFKSEVLRVKEFFCTHLHFLISAFGRLCTPLR